MLRRILVSSFLCVECFGMGFTSMGNVSTSLGGAGVALRNSAWGLYYNPALLSSDPRSKFSFSIGFWTSKEDLNPLLETSLSTPPSEISSILASLKNPRMNLQTQMGVVAQVGGFYQKKVIALPDEYGRLVSQTIEKQMSAFAIGAFASSQTNIAVLDAGNDLYEMRGLGVVLMEIPIGYAYKLETSFGDFNFGLALKYMRAVFDEISKTGGMYGGFEIKPPDFLRMNPAQYFGIDLGFLYSIADVHIGLSAKNINLPTFRANGKTLRLDPSLRFGVSYEFLKNYAVMMDVDLLPQSFSDLIPKSQMFAFGIMGDYRFVDFRVGMGMDMLNFKESKVTLGFNLFGILDVVGEMGFNFAKDASSSMVLPTNFGVKVGSTFTF